MAETQRYLTLLDWRRRMSDLYRGVRDRLERNPRDAHRYWRDERDALFRRHPQSPLSPQARAAFLGLSHFEYDPRFAFTAPMRPLPETSLDVPTSTDGFIRFVRIGAVDLPVGTLDVMWLDAYGGGLFLPFVDATAGTTTHGGGRYLLDTAKGADLGVRDAALVLDFNFAYHPSCAYDAIWRCPLAPRSSRLAVPIEAGERL
jgi:uncharacterized protein (DUF1684 family)